MNAEQAKRLIRTTFEAAYDETQFRQFTRNLLNHWEEDQRPAQSGSAVSEAFRDTVLQIKRLGGFDDSAGRSVDVLAVKLKANTTLERGRTAQRNFAAKYLENTGRDAALVAFYSDDSPEWRFSLIKLEIGFAQKENGKSGFSKTLTPAKRFSFLVGPEEGSHTAQRRLVKILESDITPSLAELEAAFNIETVTEEFFEQYKELFLLLKGDLDAEVERDTKIATELQTKGIDTATFAKRLLGQLVFLYFIQKKGWLGVPKGARWGEGPRDFLRQLFEKKVVDYQNFFDDVLEPLFYEGLALDRSHEDHYFHHLHCRIPFLNGGLFEPMNGYDWVNVPISLPNGHLEQVLDTFDLYNFTVQEDSPLDKEVAIDPEMLGKVFENLLEITDRKSKGAFYTPREIVHYMAQEALAHYLDRGLNFEEAELVPTAQQALFAGMPMEAQPKLSAPTYTVRVPVTDLKAFIRYADLATENEVTTASKPQETDAYSFKVPASIRHHAEEIDRLLAHVKVIDPAIGSGAYPVGVLTEIVRARTVLTPYLLKKLQQEDRSAYSLKRHAIFESIYGVDIDAAAVDIAKLRLWLSLVVDEEDFNNIKPLPNLDYKIVVGSSVESVAGLGQFDPTGKVAQLKEKFFDSSNITSKRQIRQEISLALQEFYKQAEKWGQTGKFDFRAEFSEVFKSGGFDIAIGNPPYVRQEAIKDLKPALRVAFPKVYNGTADLYTYFYAAAVDVLKPGGIIAFITPNKWFKANYGKTLRKHLAEKMAIHDIVDFGELPVFKTATTYPMIFIAEKKEDKREGRKIDTRLTEVKSLEAPYPDVEQLVLEQGQVLPPDAIKGETWSLMSNDLAAMVTQMKSRGIPLGEYVGNKIYWGIKTGCNEAFVIDAKKREELIAADPNSAEIIKPLAIGDDVRRWHVRDKKRYLLFTRRGIEIEKYPAVLAHLEQFRERLEPRPKNWDESKPWPGRKPGTYKWYEIQDDIAYFREFDKPKIIYPDIAKEPRFHYDEKGAYFSNTTYFIPSQDKYLIAILNSPSMWEYCKRQLTVLGDAEKRGRLRFFSQDVLQLPIPIPDKDIREKLSELVDICLNSSEDSRNQAESKINEIVANLYGLKAVKFPE